MMIVLVCQFSQLLRVNNFRLQILKHHQQSYKNLFSYNQDEIHTKTNLQFKTEMDKHHTKLYTVILTEGRQEAT